MKVACNINELNEGIRKNDFVSCQFLGYCAVCVQVKKVNLQGIVTALHACFLVALIRFKPSNQVRGRWVILQENDS